ncbi:hypothetical protein [Noviherbaspirillum sp. UKPF54]|uniref:hypothetical protein n=1 Tax=Noviherbaspirillum sp. UKPF54 TaxID=2601898 RepID=UPI0011B17113|nr:hypothetical protein [Noviherbaspirillum sp. UKPF54]QDZ26535.1 hypothetical protein FAY22_00270 [Noviherbaspirillum sp. UKPF54]
MQQESRIAMPEPPFPTKALIFLRGIYLKKYQTGNSIAQHLSKLNELLDQPCPPILAKVACDKTTSVRARPAMSVAAEYGWAQGTTAFASPKNYCSRR